MIEKEREHLKVYEEQWESFEVKTAKYIYPLIVASVIVEPKRPLAGLTDLGSLVEKIEKHADRIESRYFMMIGDREKSDIAPIVESCGRVMGTWAK